MFREKRKDQFRRSFFVGFVYQEVSSVETLGWLLILCL
jgi:hypothetical protein